MFRAPIRFVAGLAVVGVIAGLATLPAGAARRTASVPGVTDKEIVLTAMVADLDGLRAKGLIQQPKLTTANLLKKWQVYADAYGPINGRKIVFKGATWDPVDAASFDKGCLQATQVNKPFAVVNGSGFRAATVSCITVDNKTPMIYGEAVTDALQKASGDNLFSLAVPAGQAGTTAVSVTVGEGIVPKTAKVGILASNSLPGTEAGNAVEAALKKQGVTVAKRVDVNELAADSTAINKESAAAVATFKAAGVDTVYVLISFTNNVGFFQEASKSGAGFKTVLVDAASSICTQFGASRTPLDTAGTPCVTTWDTRALPNLDGVKKDNAFEAKCRKTFDKGMAETSQAGVPAGDVTAGGVTYVEDVSPNECTILGFLLPAIEQAGKNLTWAKVAKNLKKVSDGDAAYMSDGKGSFGPKKNYYADYMHLMVLNAANAQTPKDANGLFNGCPAPVNCWKPQRVGGKDEWFPVK